MGRSARRPGARVLCFLLAFSLMLAGCHPQQAEETPAPSNVPEKTVTLEAGSYGVTAAVLYDGQSGSAGWKDTLELLEQSVMIGLEAQAVDIREGYSLSGYDLVIPDAALAAADGMEQLAAEIMAFTEAGGYVLLDNAFSQVFPQSYLGISGVCELEGCPLELTFPPVGDDLAPLQELIEDLASLYPSYLDAEVLLRKDYGYGFTADTAQVLAALGDHAIYTYHEYGQGGVLLTNPLLPNLYSLGNYAMTSRGEETSFSATTASCNQLFYSRFAAYVAKRNYGYALNRVYGYYGSPSMAWELHYEVITAFAKNSMGIFDEICREYLQIPSYTLIRSTYWWFLRTETVTYLLNQSQDGYGFQMDYEESAYSSGTHVAAGGEWLNINSIENGGSYFVDYPQYNYRAYPCFGDVDGDGEDELLCGSADGCFYLYDDLAYSDRLHVSEAALLTDEAGEALQVTGFSAPQLVDLDGDGLADLVSGSDDGALYWYRNLGGVFSPQGVLIDTDIPGQTLPGVGDWNGDGLLDLAVGSDASILLLYYGQRGDGGLYYDWRAMESYTPTCVNAELGDWLAPVMVDWDGDGDLDLAVGTFDGYIAILLRDGDGTLRFDGYLDIEEMNYKGNNHVKFGNYCVPLFYDVDGDGREDLVCGALEYGLAYPIDSPYFCYQEELQAQVDYAKANYQYIGLHHYTNAYASEEREAYELKRHLEALEAYGLSTDQMGANAHTWYMSCLGDTQTLDGEYAVGLLWNSGFASPGAEGMAPQYSAENVIALPFFLQSEGEDTILVQENSVLPYCAYNDWISISAKYEMPICIYYHCDYVYRDDTEARSYVEQASQFQWEYGYNFVREDQLMKASAAALNLDVEAEYQNGVLTLTPAAKSMEGSLYDEKAQNAVGVEVQFAGGVDVGAYSTDAAVWRREGNSIYVGLDQTLTLSPSMEEASASRLEQVNLPAEITLSDTGAEIRFLDSGMLQAVVRGAAETASDGWTVTQQNGNTVFTKYGSADTLRITYTEETA